MRKGVSVTRSHLPKQWVVMLGVLVGVVALFLPFLTIKPNRVATGIPYTVWQLPQPFVVAIIVAGIGLVALLVFTVGRSNPSKQWICLWGVAVCGMALLLGVLFAVRGGARYLVPVDQPAARLSPTIGVWLLIASAYLMLDASLRRLTLPRSVNLAIWLLPTTVLFIMAIGGSLDTLAIAQEYINRQERFTSELISHITLSFTAVTGAVIIGVPLGLLAWKRVRFENVIFTLVNGVQTIPSLALFGLLIAPLSLLSQRFPFLRTLGIRGIGAAPALIALTLYALLPIVRNTYISMATIPEAIVDAGRGMGMSRTNMLRYVEFPMSLPIVLNGIRTSAVQAIGNTTIAALIGARGLGTLVFQGLGQASSDLIVLGVLPIVAMALLFDRLMSWIIAHVTPKGLVQEKHT